MTMRKSMGQLGEEVQLTFFCSANKIFQKINGQGMIGRQVSMYCDCEEIVYFPFALVLGCKSCCSDLLEL